MSKPSNRASAYWRRLGQSYGARMADQYGASCPPDWAEVIDRTDDERLNKALMAVRRDYLQYPPTLGQFEASIPKRTFGNGDSIIDRLAVYAMASTHLCEHQKSWPWNYFGRRIDTGDKYPGYETHGVMIPECESCNKPSHRILVSDLPAVQAA